MSSLAEVRLWGTRIGAVSLRDGEEVAEFQYSDEFLKSGIELSPLVMPLSNRVYRFPTLLPVSSTGSSNSTESNPTATRNWTIRKASVPWSMRITSWRGRRVSS